MKKTLLLLCLFTLWNCGPLPENCTTVSKSQTLARVVSGTWESGVVLTEQVANQGWYDTLQFVANGTDTIAYLERTCPAMLIRARTVTDTTTMWLVDSLVAHPEAANCVALNLINATNLSTSIVFKLTPTLATLTWQDEVCTEAGSDDDDDDEWDD